MKVKVTWHIAKYGDPYSEFVLCIYPSNVHTHTAVNTPGAVNTHTPWTHTRSSGQPFMLRCPGSSWGFGALLKGTSVVVLRVKRALVIHSPHLQSLPARDSNPQPLDYESDSLTIRPWLPTSHVKIVFNKYTVIHVCTHFYYKWLKSEHKIRSNCGTFLFWASCKVGDMSLTPFWFTPLDIVFTQNRLLESSFTIINQKTHLHHCEVH